MSSDNFQPKETYAKSATQGKPKWVITPEAFEKLLNSFSKDRDEAGNQYERVRIKLFRIFEWRSVGPADELVDETLDRVARRIEEGQKIDNLLGYIYGVARMVCKEKKKKLVPISLDDTRDSQHQQAPEPVEPDVRLQCFDRCLEELSFEKRHLIIDYYQFEGRDKIDSRQRLADNLGIPLNALRIRAYRLRMTLENCITHCLDGHRARND